MSGGEGVDIDLYADDPDFNAGVMYYKYLIKCGLMIDVFGILEEMM
jgi:hypothetical protein